MQSFFKLKALLLIVISLVITATFLTVSSQPSYRVQSAFLPCPVSLPTVSSRPSASLQFKVMTFWVISAMQLCLWSAIGLRDAGLN